MLEGAPVVGAREQAFPFITVDAGGFPHPALLSRAELEVGSVDLRAALRSTPDAREPGALRARRADRGGGPSPPTTSSCASRGH